jgi:hypothetical protein
MRLTFAFSWAKIILKHTFVVYFRKKGLERSSCASSASRSYANSSSTESLYPYPMMESPATSPRHAGHVGILPFQQAKYFDMPLRFNTAVEFLHQSRKEIKKMYNQIANLTRIVNTSIFH